VRHKQKYEAAQPMPMQVNTFHMETTTLQYFSTLYQ